MRAGPTVRSGQAAATGTAAAAAGATTVSTAGAATTGTRIAAGTAAPGAASAGAAAFVCSSPHVRLVVSTSAQLATPICGVREHLLLCNQMLQIRSNLRCCVCPECTCACCWAPRHPAVATCKRPSICSACAGLKQTARTAHALLTSLGHRVSRREHSPVPKRPGGEHDEAGSGKRKRSSGDKADRDAREDSAGRRGRTFTRWD